MPGSMCKKEVTVTQDFLQGQKIYLEKWSRAKGRAEGGPNLEVWVRGQKILYYDQKFGHSGRDAILLVERMFGGPGDALRDVKRKNKVYDTIRAQAV
ncbi:hypothetical protein K435DRAFT_870000 [Dendrothele bispora CBS 962.96]|uniref:Uncharacterized protein n=1 Tax=Dendrothele bispora (strain CBS 962.96) TaxID=1314807 RepID=A0A4S8L7M6_DENBC|nr:hypothetical protein K435DRAFT_870000 [Dendrothele bispora CBS 962.96]